MPAPRGGGITREGRHDGESHGSVEGQEVEDQFIRGREHAEKRKREGRQGGAEGSPPRRDSRFSNDSDSASAEATPRKKPSPMATRMVTRSAEKDLSPRTRRDNRQAEGSPTPANNGSDIPREITMNDIMQHLIDTQRKAQEKEDRYREEIRQLQTTVTTLVLDIKSLQEAAPNWGSFQSSSLQTGTTDSYASVTAQGVQLSNQEAARTLVRSTRTSVSFDLSDQSSPPQSPPVSVGTSIRSAMKKTKNTQEADMVLDIKNLETDGRTGANLMTRTKNRIIAAIRSNEGLDKVTLNQCMIRHTNNDVHLAYFKIDREAEKIASAHADEWIDMFLRGAKLIETTWYPIKVDFIPKMEATDYETGAISQETREAFAEENEVEVKLMRWLGRPKEYASFASAVAKLATKEQVEKLLQKQADGEEVYLFGCMVKVSSFPDNVGPRACYNCHKCGHTQKECKSTTRCSWCAQEGHNSCNIGEPKCSNCGGNHPAGYKKCLEFRKQQERMINLRRHD